MNYELIITHKNKSYIPSVLSDVTWETERKGTPGKLSFKMLNDKIDFTEGDTVQFKVDKKKIFLGYVFSMKSDKDNIIDVICYDQLRYLKNKDTYKVENQTSTEVIKMIADDFGLKYENLEDTKFKIEYKIEDNQTLFDIIQNSLDLTLSNTNDLYVFYDDFGKLTLKHIKNMKLNILIDDESGENYSYETSIDNNVYNQIKLVYRNEDEQVREVYIEQDTNNIKEWGLLQYFENVNEKSNIKNKVQTLLKLYNQKSKVLKLNNICGHTDVRSGSLIAVSLKVRNEKINKYMMVEQCKHIFSENHHTMDLLLKGGNFNG